jgi:hypothetical protein
MLADDWLPPYAGYNRSVESARGLAGQGCGRAGATQAEHSPLHHWGFCSHKYILFFNENSREKKYLFRENLHALENYGLIFGFAHSCHEFMFFIENTFLFSKAKIKFKKSVREKKILNFLTQYWQLSQKSRKSFFAEHEL